MQSILCRHPITGMNKLCIRCFVLQEGKGGGCMWGIENMDSSRSMLPTTCSISHALSRAYLRWVTITGSKLVCATYRFKLPPGLLLHVWDHCCCFNISC